MALVNIPRGHLFEVPEYVQSMGATGSYFVNLSWTKMTSAQASIWRAFPVWDTITIDKIGLYVGVFTTQGANPLRVSVQKVSTTTGDPNGLWATGTEVTFSPNAVGYYEVSLGTDAVITKGTDAYFGVKIEQEVALDWNLEFVGFGSGNHSAVLPYGAYQQTLGGGYTATATNTGIIVNFRQPSGAYARAPKQFCVVDGESSYSFDLVTTPDAIGMKMVVPFGCRCVGAIINADLNNEPIEIELRDSGHNVLASFTADFNIVAVTTGGTHYVYWEGGGVTLSKDGTYYLFVRPTVDASQTTMRYLTQSDADKQATRPLSTCHIVEEVDGVRTDKTDRFAYWTLIIDAIDIPSGASTCAWAC